MWLFLTIAPTDSSSAMVAFCFASGGIFMTSLHSWCALQLVYRVPLFFCVCNEKAQYRAPWARYCVDETVWVVAVSDIYFPFRYLR